MVIRHDRHATAGGFSVLEVMLAAFILIVLGTAIVTTGLKSRTQIDYEEVRRRAIAIAQERLEQVRASDYDGLTEGEVVATISLDGTTFTLRSGVMNAVAADSTIDDAKSVVVNVSWTATGGSPGAIKTVTRQVIMDTIVFRGI